jgi:dihydroxy-acid dehydratase
VPAVFGQLIEQGLIDESVMTVSGRTVGEAYRGAVIVDENVIRPFDRPLKERAGFRVLTGNIFHSAVMKMSVISQEFRDRYLSHPDHPNRFEGRAVVFDGPEDYHARIDDPSLAIDENTLLFMRGAGPKGYPGAAEVVNMRAPDYLLKRGVTSLVCIGDGRQSGTSGSPSILNASPEAASNGGLALVETGDGVVLDLNTGRLDLLVDDAELARRRAALEAAGGYQYPAHQTPWQEIQRALVGELETGAVLESAVKYQRIAQTKGLPRDNH